jgi:hypothetical protein
VPPTKKTAGWDLVLDVEQEEHNRDPKFPPLGEKLRGTVRSTRMYTDRVNGAIAQVGEIPGQRIMVDLERRHVKVIDRMTLKENAPIDKALRDLARRREDIRDDPNWQYVGDVDTSVSQSKWPTWLWWMRRLVDQGKLKVVSGGDKLPKLAEVLKMGDIRLNRHHIPVDDKSKPWNVISKDYIEDLEHLESEKLEA